MITVPCCLKERGGTLSLITPTLPVSIITENTRQWLMVSTDVTGKFITTPPRELR